jgi:hypothetical protein
MEQETKMMTLVPAKVYELDFEKIITLDDVKTVLRGLDFKWLGNKPNDNPYLQDYIKETDYGKG